jgi:hypothetical protein
LENGNQAEEEKRESCCSCSTTCAADVAPECFFQIYFSEKKKEIMYRLCRTASFLRAYAHRQGVYWTSQKLLLSGATVLVSWCGLGLENENRAEEETKEPRYFHCLCRMHTTTRSLRRRSCSSGFVVDGTPRQKNSSVLHTWMYRCLLKLAPAVPPPP